MSTRERITRGMAAGLWRALVVMLLTLVAVVGGVATTQLWPVHVETEYFTADVSVEQVAHLSRNQGIVSPIASTVPAIVAL